MSERFGTSWYIPHVTAPIARPFFPVSVKETLSPPAPWPRCCGVSLSVYVSWKQTTALRARFGCCGREDEADAPADPSMCSGYAQASVATFRDKSTSKPPGPRTLPSEPHAAAGRPGTVSLHGVWTAGRDPRTSRGSVTGTPSEAEPP